MEIGKTLYVTKRKDWRAWLKKHHATEKDIWLIYYKKDSGKPRISYNESVEEALCYGWIDSIVKGIDSEKFAQRFSPRKPTSNLSQPNKERILHLIAQKKMTKAGLDALAHAFTEGSEEPFVIAADIQKAIRDDKDAWEYFQKFPDSYKRVRIGYIEHARSRGKEEFEKRLNNFIRKTAQNKRFGFIQE